MKRFLTYLSLILALAVGSLGGYVLGIRSEQDRSQKKVYDAELKLMSDLQKDPSSVCDPARSPEIPHYVSTPAQRR